MKKDNSRACSSSRWILAKADGKARAERKQSKPSRRQNLATDVEVLRKGKGKQKHWYLTHEMALYQLLCQFK